MAFLSWAAYFDEIKGAPGNNIDGSGWNLLIDFHNLENPGAEGYLATRENTLAIVFEGSQDANDLVAAIIAQDTYFAALEGLIIQALAYAHSHPEITSLYVTGHSLGGAMAEQFAHQWAGQFAEFLDVQIATFGSPGTTTGSSSIYAAHVLNIGLTQDHVFNHSGGVALVPGIDLLLRTGFSHSVDLVHIAPGLGLGGEHDAFLYEKAMRALGSSVFGDAFIQGAQKTLIIDTLPDGVSQPALYFAASSDDLYIIGDSGVPGPDNDTIMAGIGDDWIDGGVGGDHLYGGAGDDYLYGGGGSDLLFGAFGDDTLAGGSGIDEASYHFEFVGHGVVFDASGYNAATGHGLVIDGLGGSDSLSGVEEITVLGSGFADNLKGAGPDVHLAGGGGDDTISGVAVANGGAGNDLIYAGASFAEAGNDTLIDNGVYSTPGDTVGQLSGGSGDDLLIGDGSTRVWFWDAPVGVNIDLTVSSAQATGHGTATLQLISDLEGGDFGDTLSGDVGDNALAGGAGDDRLVGRAGDDDLYGGSGLDTAVFSGARADYQVEMLAGGFIGVVDLRAAGPDGSDTLFQVEHFVFSDGTLWANRALGTTFQGGSGGETATGSAFDDVLNGLAGNDVLSAGAGSDSLDGGLNNDTLAGGTGNDFLLGGRGNDVLRGEADADVFQFARGPGKDVVSDFVVGTDHLRLVDGLAVKSWSQVGSDTVIVLNEPAAQITLVGVSGLTASTFGSLFDT